MTIAEILKLPVKERLECMEALWSSLREEELPSPEWHGDILNERRRTIESGESQLISLGELKTRLSSKKNG